jgi:hypothetical protein
VDREYIAPQLTIRETLIAGAHLVLDTLLFLLVIGVPVLVANLFSTTFPGRWKVGNLLVLFSLLCVPTAVIALLIWLI